MNFKSRIVEEQAQAYRTQHEALSVRDMIRLWLMQQNQSSRRRAPSSNPILALARTPGATQRFTLQSGIVVSVSIADAQGTALARLDDSLTPNNYQWLLSVLSRLPQDRVDLIRRHGPITVSLWSASDEVLIAIAEDDFDLGRALIDARDQEISDPAGFARLLSSSGINSEVAQRMLRRIAITPTLWEMQIEVIDPNATAIRRYTMIVEQTSAFPVVHRWGPADGSKQPETRR